MKKIIMIALVMAGFVSAGQFATVYGKIVHIRSYNGQDAPTMPTYIQIEGSQLNSNCNHQDLGNGDLTYFEILPEEKGLLAMIMSAYTANIPVRITSNDLPSHAENGHCRVVYLDLKK